mmetsp:Transcript_16648/g.47001  ORF Transcript_16648/g.47001 Transcript_16648/m.47001 type:complete len:287 (+) Transcript_16648:179-1039(+)
MVCQLGGWNAPEMPLVLSFLFLFVGDDEDVEGAETVGGVHSVAALILAGGRIQLDKQARLLFRRTRRLELTVDPATRRRKAEVDVPALFHWPFVCIGREAGLEGVDDSHLLQVGIALEVALSLVFRCRVPLVHVGGQVLHEHVHGPLGEHNPLRKRRTRCESEVNSTSQIITIHDPALLVLYAEAQDGHAFVAAHVVESVVIPILPLLHRRLYLHDEVAVVAAPQDDVAPGEIVKHHRLALRLFCVGPDEGEFNLPFEGRTAPVLGHVRGALGGHRLLFRQVCVDS